MSKEKLFTDGRKRKVKIEFSTFVGFSPGAKHWYVDIKEENDAVWDEKKQGWWLDRKERRDLIGLKFNNSEFAAFKHARKWAEMIVEENFSPQTHDVEWEDNTEEDMERYKLATPGRY